MSVKVFWRPESFNLDQIGAKRLVDISDGDTPNIRMNVRMLSIDTPETSTMQLKKAEMAHHFIALADWIDSGKSPVAQVLAGHLLPRIKRADGQDPFEVHMAQGKQATQAFEALTQARLKRLSGTNRPMFVRIADQPFDGYGRLLAYVAPEYTAAERQGMSRRDRATFNLDMVALGWAATFVIYPSIPNEIDLPMLQGEAQKAVQQGLGTWADPWCLTGYEYRMCTKLIKLMLKVKAGAKLGLGERTGWVDRYCVDISTARLYGPQDYVKVEPWNRLFIWPKDVRKAVADLNLEPAGSIAGT
ncbi:MAG TPA: thermonuclease family protein [Hydrogenophaga sp.]|uniref:thermonuclease family protein n=1 Tax=Hydrogenophaga sp. TaxID=1904254 RepID=UPI002C36C7CA|nr:thermonuclease family protein [Hydrogenophaga sp.]HMN92742.1 thermonuclease family protein [Hydrogenophaga sp.]HMP08900.1 thermonuclease family protein [Hydrogenophaga sp.]